MRNFVLAPVDVWHLLSTCHGDAGHSVWHSVLQIIVTIYFKKTLLKVVPIFL